jgi:hypothetical protein
MQVFRENSIVDTPFELLIIAALTLIFFLVIFKLANYIEAMPVRERKVKEKVVKEKKEVKVEVKKEVKEEVKAKDKVDVDVKAKSTSSCESNSTGHICPYANGGCMQPIIINGGGSDGCNNYLYDRFVTKPTMDDYMGEKKISESFLSEKEVDNIRNSNVSIRVKDVEKVSSISDKASLHNRIREMTASNLENRERLLKEFEGLSKEMKLLIIDNIIQRM